MSEDERGQHSVWIVTDGLRICCISSSEAYAQGVVRGWNDLKGPTDSPMRMQQRIVLLLDEAARPS